MPGRMLRASLGASRRRPGDVSEPLLAVPRRSGRRPKPPRAAQSVPRAVPERPRCVPGAYPARPGSVPEASPELLGSATLGEALLILPAKRKGGFSQWGFSEKVFGHEMDHRGELRDDRPAFKSYGLGVPFDKVWAPEAAQKQPKKRKTYVVLNPHLVNPPFTCS